MKRFLTTSVIPKIDFNNFVPPSKQPTLEDIESLQNWINDSKKLLVLTGAGLSTESGIPDYRSANVGLYARTNRRPVQYLEFVRNANARQRYWARNFVGWPQFSSFIPNVNHFALVEWEKKGLIHHLVTQNVDRLHSKAGSEKVVELHGCTHRVICLSCDLKMSRWELQDIIIDLNKGWSREVSLGSAIAPDGDVLLTDEQVQNFKVPPCPNCGGILKPDVVFFGDNVPGKLVDYVFKLVDESESLLVAGSSLHVYSGYRFVSRARSIGKRIAIVNIGQTRADDLAELKIEAQCGNILPKIQI